MKRDELRMKLRETADFLKNAGVDEPETGIILGTGLNDYADRIDDAVVISYSDIPNFHKTNVDSHRGQLVYGQLFGKKVVILAGRFHYYECHDMDITVFPARVLIELGVKRFIITNASGCVNTDYHAGQLMVISDHINYSGNNPLIGENLDEYGPRFPDMTYTYNRELREKLISEAAGEGIELAEGVYCMFSGPSFETPAEVRMARILGADAVGMSSVPEAIVANHAGCEIIGISFFVNMAAGILDKPLTDDDIAEESRRGSEMFKKTIDIAIRI